MTPWSPPTPASPSPPPPTPATPASPPPQPAADFARRETDPFIVTSLRLDCLYSSKPSLCWQIINPGGENWLESLRLFQVVQRKAPRRLPLGSLDLSLHIQQMGATAASALPASEAPHKKEHGGLS